MDDKILCFKINNKELFLEEGLINFNDIPMFFICKDDMRHRYAVQCLDTDKFNYYIARVLDKELIAMLEGEKSIYEFMVSAEEKWTVESGETIESDGVYAVENFEKDYLPKDDIYFTLSNPNVNSFKERLKSENILYFLSFNEKSTSIRYSSSPTQTIHHYDKRLNKNFIRNRLTAALRKFTNPIANQSKHDFNLELSYSLFKNRERIFEVSSKKQQEKGAIIINSFKNDDKVYSY